jgi:hypothetical protein
MYVIRFFDDNITIGPFDTDFAVEEYIAELKVSGELNPDPDCDDSFDILEVTSP